MEYRPLGRTGVRVSQLCFGTMSFGAEADEAASKAMYRRVRDLGINFFDCADAYTKGRAEEILGGLMKGERDDLVITSKCFNNIRGDVNATGGNRRHVVKAVEDSLKRLGTDRIDVLFMHRWEKLAPLDEVLRGLEDVVRAGKVIYIGASNYTAWQVAKGLGISERMGWTRFDVIQPMYNLVKRQAEVEILPMAQAENLGVITYSPVGGGLLSGKYRPGVQPEVGRVKDKQEYARRYAEDWMVETAGRFTEFAEKQGLHPVTLAVAWAAAHPAVTAPIVGARHTEQLEPSLKSLEVAMTQDLWDEIAALSRTPAPATDRLEEFEPVKVRG
ncbi:MAG: aldo/keto reductase [Rhodospirillales bacterium CG15_BIG_FIL_POST_REV_8_21_14_020_66_15]|nr:MAG: aldo/keto reductase [Rhodospirillales bacterium CG15_BIG_FIL_POST_REV_8_21_14_020_66_15]